MSDASEIPMFLNEQCAVILTTVPVDPLEFKDHLLNSITSLRLENEPATRIAILAAHGGEHGEVARDDDYDDYEYLL